jgi:hypothetical protein
MASLLFTAALMSVALVATVPAPAPLALRLIRP